VLELPITRPVDGQAQTILMKIPEGVVAQVQGLAGSTRWQLDVDTHSKHGERALLRLVCLAISAADAAEPWISRVASASRVIQRRRKTGPFR
jgi:hypothetical protein